jgi:thiol:disulfide interchange protein DsbA
MKRLLLAIGLVAALTGCTQKSEPAASAPAPEPATSELPATEPATSEAGPSAAEPAAPSAAAAARNTAPARPIPSKWKVDTNYQIIAPAQATNVDPGQVEIIEFMWLGCPHCYELNPYIEAWKKKLPSYVAFSQVPVTWDSLRVPHARLFYTLQALGAGDDMIVKAFEELHRQGEQSFTAEQEQKAFAVANGLDGAAFEREYNGFAVNTSIKRAQDLVRRYRVDQVPTLIVNGKYRTDVAMAGGPEKLMELLDDLASSEKVN